MKILLFLELFTLASIILWIITFTLFLAIMCARRARNEGTLTKDNRIVWYTIHLILFAGLICDTALNLIVLSVRFWELPVTGEWLATARVKRHKNHGEGWRKELAIRYCAKWLTPFDLRHCEE